MTACQLCGHPDSRHRMLDAMWGRMRAGEPIEEVLLDYQLTLREFVALTVEVGVEVV